MPLWQLKLVVVGTTQELLELRRGANGRQQPRDDACSHRYPKLVWPPNELNELTAWQCSSAILYIPQRIFSFGG